MARRADQADRAVVRALHRLPGTAFDRGIKRLTRSADHSKLWFLVGAGLAIRRGATRRGALRGVIAIAGASIAANGFLKPLLPRRRPPAELLPLTRRLRSAPASSSFPSGHAASAAAFTTAVAMESPRVGLLLAPLAAAVVYSRVHVGVHWVSDVLAGAAVGTGSALLTRRWWPVRASDEAAARPMNPVPELPKGAGLLIVVNAASGDPDYDPFNDIKRAFPEATVLHLGHDATRPTGVNIATLLERELAEHADSVRALGAVGGDGTVATVARLAEQHGLPLVVVPTGTLNHFARDVGVYDLQEAVDATSAGEAVAVTLGMVEIDGADGEERRYFLNTASLGCYPDLVALRERWQPRWGKWPAFAAAVLTALKRATPVEIRLNGTRRSVWTLFVGNGPYHPRGMVPVWRPNLSSGRLDVRWLRADLRFSRLRAFFALALAALGHSRIYGQREVSAVDVRLAEPAWLACDGEVVAEVTRVRFRAAPRPVPVYRRDENNPRWADRARPHRPW